MNLDERADQASQAIYTAVQGVSPNPMPSGRVIAVRRAALALALVAVAGYFSIQLFDNLGNRRVETADQPPANKGVEPGPGPLAPSGPASGSSPSPRSGARSTGERLGPAGAGSEGTIPLGFEIAFNRGEGGSWNIYLMNAEGSDLRKLRAGVEPEWSPDGKFIAFADSAFVGDIQLMNSDGSGVQNLRARGSFPTWSPDGGWLAFNRECDAQFGGPCDSPDGSKKDCGPECGIGVVARDGTGVRRLGNGIWPDWGPDGRIVFGDGTPTGAPCDYGSGVLQDGLPSEEQTRCGLPIWVMNPDGSGRTRLPIDKAISPTWSHDGRRIAYYTGSAGVGGMAAPTDGVFIANSDGTGIVKVAPAGYEDPSWSPDGLWLAVTRFVVGDHNIYLRGIDGSAERRLTSSNNDLFPAFSPRR